MDELIILRSGITAEEEQVSEGETWVGAVQIRGIDGKGRPFSLTLDTDDLSKLTELAAKGLRVFLEEIA